MAAAVFWVSKVESHVPLINASSSQHGISETPDSCRYRYIPSLPDVLIMSDASMVQEKLRSRVAEKMQRLKFAPPTPSRCRKEIA